MQFDTRSLWIYIRFPQLQLDLLEHTQVNNPACNRPLKQANAQDSKQISNQTLPIAIIDVTNNELCQINNCASKQGLKIGMGLASASLLCSDLHLQEYNIDIESNEISNIANHLYLLTSDIVLAPPNALILRAQNMLSLYQGLAAYWQVIQQSLHQRSVCFVAASAYSVQAAKMINLSLCTRPTNKPVSQKAKPIVKQRARQAPTAQHAITDNRDKIATLLSQCHLTMSDIDHKDLHKLARIGVKTYADLRQLPVPEIANRVSRVSMSIINELLGKQAARLKFYQPKPTYHDYMELLYDISLSDKLLPVIELCLDKLSQFLLIRNAHSLAIEIAFLQREHEPLTLTFNSIRPIYKCQDWLNIISLQLETLSFESPIFGLSIKCLQYEVAQVANDDMFAQKSTHVAAMTLLSRLQSKLGQQNVKRINFVDDFRPELCSHQSNIVSSSDAKHTRKNNSIFADRPGLLLPQPELLTLAVEVVKGPERIQTGWWDDQAINRDYYIGQSQDGQQVWIFKTPSKQWYLHGYFI